ncbi:MAG TPA: GNAT family N-acetyltransferase [Allosphingosinicella sp.]
MVPVLETARLRLRAFRADDFDRWAGVLADPNVYRWLGGTASGAEDTWRRVLASTGSWIVLGYGYWAVEAKEDGRLVGQVGFADFRREMTPSIEGLPEMGWILAPDAHGKGYASEAVAAGLAWIDAAHRPAQVAAIIDPGNLPSIRVAEKAGFAEREEAVYRDAPILLFRRRTGP